MKRRDADPALTDAPADPAVLALREGAALMTPVVVWLLRSGVSYGAFADLLKGVFVEAARAELQRHGKQPTQSALSVLSGVHRKDVRALEAEAPTPAEVRAAGVPLASQVFTRWVSDRRFCNRHGEPKVLARSGRSNSFESLCREVSRDVHPRTVLDELLRLGLARVEGDDVVAVGSAFVPSRRRSELTALFAANAADHIAAAVHNLTSDGPRFLEQSVFADGLSADSVQLLHDCARTAWQEAFAAAVAEANRRVEADAEVPSESAHRIRFGTYFFSEPQSPGANIGQDGQATMGAPAAKGTRGARPRRKV